MGAGLLSEDVPLVCKGSVAKANLVKGLGHITRIRVEYHESPLTELLSVTRKNTCLLLVFRNSAILSSSLACMGYTSLSLMHEDKLVVDLDSLVCNYPYRSLCSYSYIQLSGDDATDRLSIIDACTRVIGDEFYIYDYVTDDPAEVLGVDYARCIYVPLVSESIDPEFTVYLAISEGVVATVRVD